MSGRSLDLGVIVPRLTRLTLRPASADPSAAVAAILRDGSDGAEVLLIKRAEREGDPWSGQMAFPGGRRDPSDRDLLATAVRETLEEVGLDLDAGGKLVGPLPDTPTHKTGLVVRPYVFTVTGDPPLAYSPEVAHTVWAPLGPFARGERKTTYSVMHEGAKWTLPGYLVGDEVVWGLTYRFLQSLFEELE
ncbi:MAG: CoA pyrophosphatase [Myxococcales bacterium]|jgi:8-oxo-dGTP pyrophosphatase MutT (NUDIX family)|nr:CoA pyrophosphatase [Myxococcales bacterium]